MNRTFTTWMANTSNQLGRGIFSILTMIVLTSVTTAQQPNKFTVFNATDRPIYVALARKESGGHDGLGGPGSWRLVRSQGFFTIGAYQERTFNVGGRLYLLAIGHKGLRQNHVLTRQAPDTAVRQNFLDAFVKDAAFNYTVFMHDSTGQNRVGNSIQNVIRDGAKKMRFEPMFDNKGWSYGNFVIRWQ